MFRTLAMIQGIHNQRLHTTACHIIKVIVNYRAMAEYALFLRALAEQVMTARLANGLAVRDATDFQQWLLETAVKADAAKSVEEFLLQL